MGSIVEIIFSFEEGFFEFNSLEEKVSKRIKRVITGTLIFIICMIILIAYIVTSNENFSINK